MPVEPHFVYSNRSYWYPQVPVTDYATAALTDHRAGETRRRGQRHAAGQPSPADPLTPGQRPAQAVRVRNGEADALLRLHHQPLPRPRRRAVEAARTTDVEPGEVAASDGGVASNRTVNCMSRPIRASSAGRGASPTGRPTC